MAMTAVSPFKTQPDFGNLIELNLVERLGFSPRTLRLALRVHLDNRMRQELVTRESISASLPVFA